MYTVSPPRSVAVLDSAIAWTHSCLQLARTSSLTQPTPCRSWNLGQLLAHMDDSLVTIAEAAELGHVAVDGDPSLDHEDPGPVIDRIVERACRTRAVWQQRLTSAPVTVGDLALGRDTVALVGALEIAVHGWDVACAAGQERPLPADLALRLHDVALAVVTPEERGGRFGPPLEVPAFAPVGARLLAHLGRGPSSSRPGQA